MISITRHIEYLITCHDCVIVPGWGAFIANSSPARIIDDGTGVSVLMPPMRTISFNPSINHNDGLLVTSLMRREGLSYDTAIQEIENQVGRLRRELDSNGEVSLPKIGSFTLNPETPAPVFTPEADTLADAPYFGLPRIRQTILMPPALPASTDDISDILNDRQLILEDKGIERPRLNKPYHLPTPLRRGLRRGLRVAASITLLLGLGLVISTPITVDKSTSNFASVDPSAALPKVTGPKPARVVSSFVPKIPEDAELSIVIPQEEEVAEPTGIDNSERKVEENRTTISKQPTGQPNPVVAPTDVTQEKENNPQTAGYYLIVASLESRDRAEKYLASINDPTLRILEEDKRYRVYAAAGNSVHEAMQRTKDPSFSAAHPDAWVYHRQK